MNGIIIIDKPSGITSHDVVARIRRVLIASVPAYQRTSVPKVGHGGTLDPLATGVLPILIGSATKLSSKVMDGEKEYLATIKFGEATDTDDAEGKVIDTKPVPADLLQRLKTILPQFMGKIQQVPPNYSAIKIKGRCAYKIARKDEVVDLPERSVEVFELEILKEAAPYIDIRVKCSKGLYIRSLARDFGAKIGCGGHIYSLRRTVCGRYTITNAMKLNEISTLQDIERMLHAPDF